MMMRIFYIDWQQYWKYDRTMNIGANAHGKRAVSTLKIATSDRLDLRWQLGFQWHGIGIELILPSPYLVPRLFHNATVSQCDHFLLLHMYMYLLFESSPGWRVFFFNSIWWGPLSSNVFTICAVYWSLGRRGYFGVSNVVLVQYYSYMPKICFKNCRICMFSIELGSHIFVSVLIIYLRMTLTLFGIEAFTTLPIAWVIPVYFGQQIVIKWLLMSLSCKF